MTPRNLATPPPTSSKFSQIESSWVEKQQRAQFQNGGDHWSNMFRIEFIVGKGQFLRWEAGGERGETYVIL